MANLFGRLVWSSGVPVDVVLGIGGKDGSIPGLRNEGNTACTLCMALWVVMGNHVRWEAWFVGKRWEIRGFYVRLG